MATQPPAARPPRQLSRRLTLLAVGATALLFSVRASLYEHYWTQASTVVGAAGVGATATASVRKAPPRAPLQSARTQVLAARARAALAARKRDERPRDERHGGEQSTSPSYDPEALVFMQRSASKEQCEVCALPRLVYELALFMRRVCPSLAVGTARHARQRPKLQAAVRGSQRRPLAHRSWI